MLTQGLFQPSFVGGLIRKVKNFFLGGGGGQYPMDIRFCLASYELATFSPSSMNGI